MFLIAAVCTVGNWAILVAQLRGKRTSLVVLKGAAAGALGACMCPVPEVRKLWWVFPLVDIGCAPSIVLQLGYLIYRRWWRRV